MNTHRTLAGDWALCATPDACELLFHFPNRSPAEMADIPLEMLVPLLNVIDPATYRYMLSPPPWWGYLDEQGNLHREYDLPATFDGAGEFGWWQHGFQHRGNGRPALTNPDGLRVWYVDGKPHRHEGPAVVAPVSSKIFVEGRASHVTGMQYWLHGRLLVSDAAGMQLTPAQWAEMQADSCEQRGCTWQPGA